MNVYELLDKLNDLVIKSYRSNTNRSVVICHGETGVIVTEQISKVFVANGVICISTASAEDEKARRILKLKEG